MTLPFLPINWPINSGRAETEIIKVSLSSREVMVTLAFSGKIEVMMYLAVSMIVLI